MPNKKSAKKPCSTVTDPTIVRAVKKAFKADHTFDGQRTHMGVNSKGRVVTLTGFVTSKALKKKAGELVGAIRCVKKVNNILGDRFATTCGPTQRACCGGCIDRTLTCNCIE
jgi:osmotically-inducible protein OsmY